MNKATFGAGCFWGVEKCFRKKFQDSIKDIQVGYCGGTVMNASYQQVCSGKTGHAEVVHFSFDPNKTSFAELCDFL